MACWWKWRAIGASLQVEESGAQIRCQPGVIGARANQMLAPYGAKIGPDPASIATCTIGGILSNNSSGMCCGVEQNAYHTLHSMRFMLPSGTVIDTAAGRCGCRVSMRASRELARGVLELKAQLQGDSALRERVRSKYRMKNTTGYSLNAFLDFEQAVDIFQHVLIGSEGTLAFIAEAVLNTVPDLPVKYTGLLLFPDLYAAAESIVPLRQAGAKALEIMDRASLRSVENQAGVPASLRTFRKARPGLLVEFQSADEAERTELERVAADAVGGLKLLRAGTVHPRRRRTGAAVEDSRGHVSVGGFGAQERHHGHHRRRRVSRSRRWPTLRTDLTKLFHKHEYDNAIIFGHAKDGNLHFVITQSFNDAGGHRSICALHRRRGGTSGRAL